MSRVRARAGGLGALPVPAGDVVLAGVLCAAWVVEVLANGPRPAPLAATLIAGWALIAPILWRRRAPAGALAAHGTLMVCAAALGTAVLEGPHNVPGVVVAVLVYSVGAHSEGRALAAGVAVGIVVVAVHAALVDQPFDAGTVLGLAAFVGAATLAGRALRQRRLLTRELEEHAARLRAERETRARGVADDERRRIARELHDVVTHVLGEMVVQAASLGRLRDRDGAEMARVFGEIERAGRDALAELRRLLGVLRTGGPQPLAPPPGVAQLDRLVTTLRSEGVPVELVVEGGAAALPAGVGVSVYRVVEETLAGMRDRGVRRARVTLCHRAASTDLEVVGERPAGPTASAERRTARLAAIRERVAVCGGEFRSAAEGDARLAVWARFPHRTRAIVAGWPTPMPAAPAAQPLPPAARDRRRAVRELALAVALLAALVLDAVTDGDLQGSAVANVLAFALLAGTCAWCRRAPLIAAATFALTAVALTAWLTPVPDLQTAQIALVLMVYRTAAVTSGRRAAVALAVLAGAVLATILIYGVARLASREVYALVTLTALAWVAGRTMRSRALLNRALREKAAALERERDERARATAAEVRREIARELHDVVAHGLTVIVVQAGSARRIAEADPDEAAEVAGLIESTGRDAVGEMRRLLTVMTDAGDGSPRTAQAGIDSLEALLERSRGAGLPVELTRDGEPRPLPAGVDVAAYRVVQEALTNTIRHAGASRAELMLRYGDDALELVVVDDGHGPSWPPRGGGHGLAGMRERVGVYGGELEASRDERGGFRVRARFPLVTGTTSGAVRPFGGDPEVVE